MKFELSDFKPHGLKPGSFSSLTLAWCMVQVFRQYLKYFWWKINTLIFFTNNFKYQNNSHLKSEFRICLNKIIIWYDLVNIEKSIPGNFSSDVMAYGPKAMTSLNHDVGENTCISIWTDFLVNKSLIIYSLTAECNNIFAGLILHLLAKMVLLLLLVYNSVPVHNSLIPCQLAQLGQGGWSLLLWARKIKKLIFYLKHMVLINSVVPDLYTHICWREKCFPFLSFISFIQPKESSHSLTAEWHAIKTTHLRGWSYIYSPRGQTIERVGFVPVDPITLLSHKCVTDNLIIIFTNKVKATRRP